MPLYLCVGNVTTSNHVNNDFNVWETRVLQVFIPHTGIFRFPKAEIVYEIFLVYEK